MKFGNGYLKLGNGYLKFGNGYLKLEELSEFEISGFLSPFSSFKCPELMHFSNFVPLKRPNRIYVKTCLKMFYRIRPEWCGHTIRDLKEFPLNEVQQRKYVYSCYVPYQKFQGKIPYGDGVLSGASISTKW